MSVKGAESPITVNHCTDWWEDLLLDSSNIYSATGICPVTVHFSSALTYLEGENAEHYPALFSLIVIFYGAVRHLDSVTFFAGWRSLEAYKGFFFFCLTLARLRCESFYFFRLLFSNNSEKKSWHDRKMTLWFEAGNHLLQSAHKFLSAIEITARLTPTRSVVSVSVPFLGDLKLTS